MRSHADQIADPRTMLIVAVLALTIAGCAGGSGRVAPVEDPARNATAELADARAQRLASPVEAYWPYRIAQLELLLGNPAVAESELAQALALNADHTPSLLLLSKMRYEAGRHEEAVALLEGALNRGAPEPDALRVALALNFEALGENEAARDALAGCASNPGPRPTAETFLSLRGDDYLQSRPIAEAALEADPASAANHNNYGIALLYDGDPELARASFLKALELDPQLAGALYNLAIVEFYYFYDLDKGREWFRRYAALDDEDPDDLGAALGVDLAAAGSGWAAPNEAGDLDAQ